MLAALLPACAFAPPQPDPIQRGVAQNGSRKVSLYAVHLDSRVWMGAVSVESAPFVGVWLRGRHPFAFASCGELRLSGLPESALVWTRTKPRYQVGDDEFGELAASVHLDDFVAWSEGDDLRVSICDADFALDPQQVAFVREFAAIAEELDREFTCRQVPGCS